MDEISGSSAKMHSPGLMSLVACIARPFSGKLIMAYILEGAVKLELLLPLGGISTGL